VPLYCGIVVLVVVCHCIVVVVVVCHCIVVVCRGHPLSCQEIFPQGLRTQKILIVKYFYCGPHHNILWPHHNKNGCASYPIVSL
jgi:hypothetical protein